MTALKKLCRIQPSLGQDGGSQVVISGFNRGFFKDPQKRGCCSLDMCCVGLGSSLGA